MKKALIPLLVTLSLGQLSVAQADTIDNFNASWAGKALSLQRKLEANTPLADISQLGTHNSYNSEVYRDIDSYIDPQQKYSIYDQLRMGARFIELDAHWTIHTHGWPWNWGSDLLLCHSGIGTEIGNYHLGCSTTDRFVKDGVQEVANWLVQNPEEVIILYIEDHTDNHHGELVNILNSKLGGKIYASGGCQSIPSNLTKAQVRAAGKQVVLWKDGGCSSHSSMKNMAYTGLGSVDRVWEDRTTIGSVFGSKDYISVDDVVSYMEQGKNIVNLDDMNTSDGRIAAGIWSWDNNEPNNLNNEDCAMMWGNGRWNDASCSNHYRFACYNTQSKEWALSYLADSWDQGNNACAELGANWTFSVPHTAVENLRLREAGGTENTWLNFSDRNNEGVWSE